MIAFWLRVRPARRAGLSDRQFYARALAVAYLVWIASFYAVGSFAATLSTRDPTTSWDRAIPLVPEAIWLYEVLYVFPAIALVAIRDWHRFNKALLGIALCCVVAYATYLAVPLAFPRPELDSSLSARVLAAEYAADFSPGANNLPSLHVAFAWLIVSAARGQRLGRIGDAVLILTAIGISVATLLVKQHVIIDVVAGIALAAGAHAIAGFAYPRIVDPSALPRDALHQLWSVRRWIAARGDR